MEHHLKVIPLLDKYQFWLEEEVNPKSIMSDPPLATIVAARIRKIGSEVK